MRKTFSFIYGVFCYLVFMFAFLYMIGFVSNLVVPKSIDTGSQSNLTQSLMLNVGLLGLFAIQHTVMARPSFKRWWTKIIPVELERSTYVLAASLFLLLLYWQWRPMPDVIWSVDNPTWKAVLFGLFWVGWGTVLFSSFIINHFDLFGLRQVWFQLTNQDYNDLKFETKSLYLYIRHPLMLGIIIGVWSTPHMTTGHLVFASSITAYILIGIQFEERTLIQFHGKDYENYRQRVPMLIPFLTGRTRDKIKPSNQPKHLPKA
jgi:protein-S-isoprenylcysteine O-methyltransferase Ste14